MVKDKVVIRQDVAGWFEKLGSAKDVYALFKDLNYPSDVLFDFPSKRKKSGFDFKKEEDQKVREIYSVLSFDEKLSVFLVESSTLHQSFIKYITKAFADRYIRFLLIVTVNYKEIVFVFPDYEKKQTGSHKLKITKLVVNKDELHYTDVETLTNLFYAGSETSWRDVWKKWKEAFNVERVTLDFFEDYKKAFFKLRSVLDKQGLSRKDSHEFTLQFLNRLMFVYFISKKGWLKFQRFMAWFWKAYLEDRNKGNSTKDSFYSAWLNQIFFKAFNNRNSDVKGVPQEVKKALSDFPYLNGGLFTKNDLDVLKVKIPDDLFKQILEFFERYNFTIKEDMPLESEVAVDPLMLGYVYESLANVAEEIYDRNDMGIFYTPRVEVDFMCRRTLVEYLSKHISEIPKEKFYTLIFDPLEDKEKIEAYFQKENFWDKLEEALEKLSVIDPACGSGAFLVGMLNVLVGLYRMIYKYHRVDLTDFQLKKRIVGRSLYGVDVMPWAIHAAELRLWLQLIIETEFKKNELRKAALLPNLNMNLRIGDSLVQEIGGINLNLRSSNISKELKDRLNELKFEKQNYFNEVSTAKFKRKEEIIAEETRIFEDIIRERIRFIIDKIAEIKKTPKQMTLFGEDAEEKENEEKRKAQIEALSSEKDKLEDVLKKIGDPEKRPFVWDIDFAEIFGDKNGFDIVIGNPPYVRQEMISPPNKIKNEVKLGDKKEYKEKLMRSVRNQFSVIETLDKRSDYYIYFYFHGLSLLNKSGTFCFITSNSWLDVGYGKDLQEFLLKYVPIHAIYDNPKRSFAHADINTIITLFGAPKLGEQKQFVFAHAKKSNWPNKDNSAKFVMLKKPFEEVLTARNLIDIESINVNTKGEGIVELVRNVAKTSDYRVFPVIQEDLLEDGWEYPEDYDRKAGRFKIGKYEGNKWGGKYLRAPDIFYTVLEKGKEKLIVLRDILPVKAGCYSGINEFFYISKAKAKKLKLENKYLVKLFKSPQESDRIELNANNLNKFVLICQDKIAELKSSAPNTFQYIKWGEKQKTKAKGKVAAGIPWPKVATVKNRKPAWYSIRDIKPARVFLIYGINDRYIFWYSPIGMISDRRLHMGYPKKENSEKEIVALLNSTLVSLFIELEGRVNLGEGALDFATKDANNIFIIKPNIIVLDKLNMKSFFNRTIKPIFEETGINPLKPINEQEPKPLPDRKEIDDIVFDALDLTKEERKEVYRAVCELVKQRLNKAKSLGRD